MNVLGINVPDELFGRWLGWYAPGRQPFRSADVEPQWRELSTPPSSDQNSPHEWRDTFFTYASYWDGGWVWLDEQEVAAQSPSTRSTLRTELRRRVRPKPLPAWPSDPLVEARLVRWVEAGNRPSLHPLAREQLKRVAAGLLPRAAEIAGTFPEGSGPNCFRAVRLAAGGADDDPDLVEPDAFARWLADRTIPVGPGHPDEGAQVLVWHDHGQLAHAAVTVGDGWTLQKPSQAWCSPTGVWPTDEVIASWRLPGVKLSRHQLR